MPVDEALIDAVGTRFGCEIRRATPIERGDEASVWRAETGRGPMIVHVGAGWRSTEELAWTHRVIRYAAAHVPQALAPLAGTNGSTFFLHDGRPVTLFEFVDGYPLDPGDRALVDHSARLLSCIHSALADWSDGPRPPCRPGGPGSADPADDPRELVDHELDRWWAAMSGSLAAGVLHGDYYPRNLLCRSRRVVAVIDWHEARIGPIAGEVAWAAWEIAHDHELRLLPDRAARFLLAYGPGAPSPALAVSLMRVWLRENIRHALMLDRHGQPVDDHYLDLQLHAFVELRWPVT